MVMGLSFLMAQTPEKFNYQAVIRNASNQLIANANVGVRVSILQGSASGSAVYVETQTASTNVNGLMNLSIGGGNAQQGSFAGIDWSNGPFFLKTEIDPNGGSNYSITSSQQLLSVPYALYAKEAGNVPSDVSALNNDAGYITDSVLQQIIEALNARIDSLENVVNAVPDTVDSQPCPGIPTLMDYDGNIYNTVQIGQQCWMKSNLRTKHFRNGVQINTSTSGSYTQALYYQPTSSELTNYNEVNYGIYYNWPAVSDSNGLCPLGWHVPSFDEFYQLVDYTRNQSEYFCGSTDPSNYGGVGKALSSTIGWMNSTYSCAVGNDPTQNNATGFSAFPAGSWFDITIGTLVHFLSAGYNSFMWSSTLTSDNRVWVYHADYNESNFYGATAALTFNSTEDFDMYEAYSVRCVKD